ncbi:MAG: type 1 glutamine amidotransferase [Nitrosotalea sp.]
MLVVVDNGSVYTESILDFLKTTDVKFDQLRFDEISITSLSKYPSIILSGRRQNNPKMNAINAKIIKHALENRKPLLGICYGAEILALTLGGTIKKMEVARQGIHEIDVIKDNPICTKKIRAFESHSYMIAKLDSSFKQVAKSSTCEFEIFQLNGHNIFGTQFHPEMSEDGRTLLGKFISIQ